MREYKIVKVLSEMPYEAALTVETPTIGKGFESLTVDWFTNKAEALEKLATMSNNYGKGIVMGKRCLTAEEYFLVTVDDHMEISTEYTDSQKADWAYVHEQICNNCKMIFNRVR